MMSQNLDIYSFNNLSPAEAERLAILSEELGEAQQIIGKILRHGYNNYNPHDYTRTNNRRLLEMELGHVQSAIKIIVRNNDVSSSEIRFFEELKLTKINKYLHHNQV